MNHLAGCVPRPAIRATQPEALSMRGPVPPVILPPAAADASCKGMSVASLQIRRISSPCNALNFCALSEILERTCPKNPRMFALSRD
jgi:hypothetical protein